MLITIQQKNWIIINQTVPSELGDEVLDEV